MGKFRGVLGHCGLCGPYRGNRISDGLKGSIRGRMGGSHCCFNGVFYDGSGISNCSLKGLLFESVRIFNGCLDEISGGQARGGTLLGQEMCEVLCDLEFATSYVRKSFSYTLCGATHETSSLAQPIGSESCNTTHNRAGASGSPTHEGGGTTCKGGSPTHGNPTDSANSTQHTLGQEPSDGADRQHSVFIKLEDYRQY